MIDLQKLRKSVSGASALDEVDIGQYELYILIEALDEAKSIFERLSTFTTYDQNLKDKWMAKYFLNKGQL